MNRFIRKLALAFLFLENLYIPLDYGFDFRFNYIFFILYVIIILVLINKVSVRLGPIIFLVTLTIYLLVVPILSGFNVVDTIKQIILLALHLIFSILLVNQYKRDVISLYKDYLGIIFFASIIGIVQFCSMIISFRPGADYSFFGFEMQNFSMEIYKVQSWFQEPSFLAYAFVPAVFTAVYRLLATTELITMRKSILIIVVVLLSQSAVAYLTLLLSAIIIFFSHFSIARHPLPFLSVALIIGLAILAAYRVPDIKIRIDDTYQLFFEKDLRKQDIESKNISTYALFSNFKVSMESFKKRPIIGSGLGTYEHNYDYFINKVIPPNALREDYALNKKEANSLLFRVSAELGLVGLLLFIWFISKYRISLNYVLKNRLDLRFWVINNSILVLILARMLRLGHYTLLGFIMFLVLYYYSSISVSLLRKSSIV